MTPEAKRAYQREWEQKRRESMTPEERNIDRAYQREYKRQHKEKYAAMSLDWKRRNPERQKVYRKQYLEQHREHEQASHRVWLAKNGDQLREVKKRSDRDYYQKNKAKWREYKEQNRTRINAANRHRRATNPDPINDAIRRRRLTDPQYAILCRLRSSLHNALKKAGQKKTRTTFKLIGIPIQEFLKYLESLFQPGMSWENRAEWHIDHVRPCATFELSDPEQQRQCFHYTNLQPLWGVENMRKNSHWEGKVYRHIRALPSQDPQSPLNANTKTDV
jgi:hypothetical protein